MKLPYALVAGLIAVSAGYKSRAEEQRRADVKLSNWREVADY
jgi:hypothetical protein